MFLTNARAPVGTVQLWVLVFLLLFLALFGVHLFVLHADGDAHAFEIALTVQLGVVLAVALACERCLLAPAAATLRILPFRCLKVPRGALPGCSSIRT
ncbi:hypothetical protein BH23ACT12_BH23ACT12_17200 [soil metagenome]